MAENVRVGSTDQVEFFNNRAVGQRGIISNTAEPSLPCSQLQHIGRQRPTQTQTKRRTHPQTLSYSIPEQGNRVSNKAAAVEILRSGAAHDCLVTLNSNICPSRRS